MRSGTLGARLVDAAAGVPRPTARRHPLTNSETIRLERELEALRGAVRAMVRTTAAGGRMVLDLRRARPALVLNDMAFLTDAQVAAVRAALEEGARSS